MHDAFANMAQAFSESSTYEVGDIVVYGTTTYKCHTAVTTAGSWTGSTNWQVYRLSEGGGGTSDYPDLTNKPQINGVTLSGNKTASDLSLQDKMQYSTMPTASADNEGKIYQYVGTTDANYTNGYYYKCVENSGSYSWQLVENINDQTPTFTEASTRNNIASGEKLSVIMGKVQKFFNDLKTVAFSGSYTDLSDKPNADDILMSDGVTSVEDALDGLMEDSSDTLSNTTYLYANATIIKKGSVVMIQWNGLKGLTNQTTNTLNGLIPKKYRPRSTINFDLCPPSTASVLDIYRINIKTNGNVTVYPYNGVSAQNNLNTTITYLI
jgi:hypothetical protein